MSYTSHLPGMKMRRSKVRWSLLSACVGGLIALLSLPASGAAPMPDESALPATIDFNRDVRPILSDTCFKCHGLDPATRKADLRLDTLKGATAELGGYAAIVPGKPAESSAFQRLITNDPSELMPPPKSGMKLTPRQIAVLKKWIEQGAEYKAHWAYIPPAKPELPRVKQATWVKNGIDAFVLAKLEGERLQPSRDADRTTLIRRLTLDLTGLPPTPAEVDAFLADTSADAYEKVVDRLLASPHYGERMAQFWLDAARYADSSGYQADWERTMWPWRDWVTKAFNDNMSFDRFTIEQLAGDMLPNATIEQRLASGFNRNHRINDEGGIIPEEYAVEYVIDRVETTSAVFMGMTAGCARCHDHKYDPLTQKEFYQLYAYFNNVPEKGQDGRAGYAAPFMRVPLPEDAAKIEQLARKADGIEQQLEKESTSSSERQAAWERQMIALLAVPGGDPWRVATPLSASASSAELHRQPDGSVLVKNVYKDAVTYVLNFQPDADKAPLEKITAVRLEAMTDEALPDNRVGLGDGNFLLNRIEVLYTPAGATKPVTLKIKSAQADHEQAKQGIASVIAPAPAPAAKGAKPAKPGKAAATAAGWAVDGDVLRGQRTAIFVLEQPIETRGAKLTVRLVQGSKGTQQLIGRARISFTATAEPTLDAVAKLPDSVRQALTTAAGARSPKQKDDLADYFRWVDPERRSLWKELIAARRSAAELAKQGTAVMVMQEMAKRRDTYLLKRGLYDQPDKSEKLSPGLPAALFPKDQKPPKDRLELARWLVEPGNPLTARVTVNRFWQQIFGTGLVKTSEDFGFQGEWPSHPELLDWLAKDFAGNGWDVKRLMKQIVTSATYRQSSAVTPELLERDPDNRLLARSPRYRLDALAIRDNALAVSGLLTPKIGGPTVKPYQPPGLWEELAFTDKTSIDRYVQAKGPDLYRRTMYTFWKRTVPPPALAIFDAGGREVCTIRTSRTNTPLQALNLLNDVTYVEAARVMAARVLREGGATQSEKLAYAFRLATARTPDAREASLLATSLDRYLAKYKGDSDAAAKLVSVGEFEKAKDLPVADHAAYTAVCNVILNLDETVTRE